MPSPEQIKKNVSMFCEYRADSLSPTRITTAAMTKQNRWEWPGVEAWPTSGLGIMNASIETITARARFLMLFA
jgi:hypothetical protein